MNLIIFLKLFFGELYTLGWEMEKCEGWRRVFVYHSYKYETNDYLTGGKKKIMKWIKFILLNVKFNWKFRDSFEWNYIFFKGIIVYTW